MIPGKAVPKKKGFHSILEHEFAHVNQMISRGLSPSLETCRSTAEVIFEQLCSLTKFEYEANFIQLSHDPTFFPPVMESLEEWCCLRGYSSGIETAIFRLCTEEKSSSQAKKLFKLLETKLPETFEKIGLDRKIGESFVSELQRVWCIALLTVMKRYPEIEYNQIFIELMKWSEPKW